MKSKHKDSIIATFICLAFMFAFCAIVVETRGQGVDYPSTFIAVSVSIVLAGLCTKIKEVD